MMRYINPKNPGNFTHLFNAGGLAWYEGPRGDEDPLYVRVTMGPSKDVETGVIFVETDFWDEPDFDEASDYHQELKANIAEMGV